MVDSTSLQFVLLLSQAPVVTALAYIYLRDSREAEPFRLLFFTFLLGALSSVLAGFIEYALMGDEFLSHFHFTTHFVHAFFYIGFIEEAVKLLAVLLIAYRSRHFNEPYDGIIYTCAASLGFAGLENFGYVLMGGPSLGLYRIFTAIPIHTVCGVVMGFYLGLAKFNKTRQLHYMLLALGTAGILHGLYDYMLLVQIPALAIASYVFVIAQIVLARRAIVRYRGHPPVDPERVCFFLPDASESYVPGKGYIAAAVLYLGGITAFLVALGIALRVGEFALIPFYYHLPHDALAMVFGIASGILLILTESLKRGSKVAQLMTLGLFVLCIPTPLFPFAFLGIYGLLDDDRDAEQPLTSQTN